MRSLRGGGKRDCHVVLQDGLIRNQPPFQGTPIDLPHLISPTQKVTDDANVTFRFLPVRHVGAVFIYDELRFGSKAGVPLDCVRSRFVNPAAGVEGRNSNPVQIAPPLLHGASAGPTPVRR